MLHGSRRGQSGQALVVVAGIVIALTLLGALVFDVGLAQSDRRNLQAYADAAALAGSRSYTATSTAGAHWVALQYLTGPLNFTLPLAPCTSSTTCPAGTYTASPYTIQLADSTLANWPYPSALDVVIIHQQPGIFSAMLGFGSVTVGSSGRAALPGPLLTGSVYALAAVSGDALINGGGAAFQSVTGAIYAKGSFGANNPPHSTGIPSKQTNFDGTTCPGSPANRIDYGGTTNLLNWHTTDNPPNPVATQSYSVAPPYTFDQNGPTSTGPTYTTTGAAKDALGRWKPGIYNGIFPSGGLMNGGVYKIINVSATISLGTITNTIYTPAGTADTLGAVAIVLDSSDTATIDITNAVLNGIDDLNSQLYFGPRDPMGTHNFVIYAGNGPTGYSQMITVGPGATTNLSGIIYAPLVVYSSNGSSSPSFTGAATFASMTVFGGGAGLQVFHWVCGLNAVQPLDGGGGLIR